MRLMVAVTGGIGAGKSTVSARLRELGAVVIDSDQLAREVVAPGSSGLTAIAEAFGPQMVGGDGGLDRAALAAVVFADPAARRTLEHITHPRVRARFVELTAATEPGSVVVNDIPILVDLAVAATFHLVIGVHAAPSVRVERLIGRGLTEADARARLAAQISDDDRRLLCDVWLPNDSTADHLTAAVDDLWISRILPFRDALVAGRRDGGGVPPDDPARERARHRVARALDLPMETVALSAGGLAVPGPDTADRTQRLAAAGFPPGSDGVTRAADPALALTVVSLA